MERPIIKESDLCDDGGYLLNPKFAAEKINKIFDVWATEMEEENEDLSNQLEEMDEL